MPNLADYVVLADGKVSLQIGGDIDHSYSFNPPQPRSAPGARFCLFSWRQKPIQRT
jgi:hypothetical protein